MGLHRPDYWCTTPRRHGDCKIGTMRNADLENPASTAGLRYREAPRSPEIPPVSKAALPCISECFLGGNNARKRVRGYRATTAHTITHAG